MIKEGMELLRDEFVYSKECYENVTPQRKGVLRTIKGPVAEWGSINRNNRKYSEKLWDNVLGSDYVKEQTENKCLYGEANHPEGRYEVDFARVSHNITEMHKSPDKQQVYASIDILDTPLGNILNVLYEYGSVLGFSSRAGGILHNKKGFVEVDEDSFHFITFDAVPYPSVVSARPLHESGNNPSRVDVSEEAHNKILRIIEESGKKDKEVLKAFIYSLQDYNLDKEISILEGLNIDKDTSDIAESLKGTTLCLLKESYRQISSLKSEKSIVERQLEEVSKKIDEHSPKLTAALKKIQTLTESNQKLEVGVKETKEENIKLLAKIEDVNQKNGALLDTFKIYENSIDDMELKLLEKDVLRTKVEKELVVLTSQVKENSELLNKLTAIEEENSKLKAENEEAKKIMDYDDIVTELGKVVKEHSAVRENFDLNNLELDKARNDLNNTIQEVNKVVNENTELAGLLRETLQDTDNLNEQVVHLNEQVVSMNEQITGLSGIVESYKIKVLTYQEDLVKSICGQYNAEPRIVTPQLKEGFTSEDVFLVCESMSNNRTIELIGITEEIDEEDSEEIQESKKRKERLSGMFETNRRGKVLIKN